MVMYSSSLELDQMMTAQSVMCLMLSFDKLFFLAFSLGKASSKDEGEEFWRPDSWTSIMLDNWIIELSGVIFSCDRL